MRINVNFLSTKPSNDLSFTVFSATFSCMPCSNFGATAELNTSSLRIFIFTSEAPERTFNSTKEEVSLCYT